MIKNRINIALAGNPNCGKTTIFNNLTGGKQRIGNWPGVTVEKKEGTIKHKEIEINIVDLPGIYSLSAYSEDEKVSRDYLLSGEPDLVINIIDATNLERNLYLTTQLIEMKVPMIILLNMIDLANKQNIIIDIQKLSERLGLDVISVCAINKNDIEKLKNEIISDSYNIKPPKSIVHYPNEVEEIVQTWHDLLIDTAKEVGSNPRWVAIQILEHDAWITKKVLKSNKLTENDINEKVKKIENLLGDSTIIILADYRYGFINSITKEIIKRIKNKKDMTDKIDKITLNSFLGIPIFLFVMYIVFWVTMNLGGAFIDFFSTVSGIIFVDGLRELLLLIKTPQWLISILSNGVGTGIQTIASFIPIIFFMFFMLSILEDSGYMSRIAFIMDKYMRLIGLGGKAFVPLLVGFGCTVPAIMATRTLESKKDKYMTIFMAPLMSCGARLPVYTLFAAAFFTSKYAGNVVFLIYIIGIVISILTGLLLKNTIFKGESSHLLIELPPYHIPRIKHIMLHTWNKLKHFIFKAGKFIIIAVTILGFFNSLSIDGKFNGTDPDKSILSKLSKIITPIFKPMGIDEKNWPATVALISGIFAKESIVGTLNAIYIQSDLSDTSKKFNIIKDIKESFISIYYNLKKLLFDDIAGILKFLLFKEKSKNNTEESQYDNKFLTAMKSHFSKGWIQAFSYLIFVLIYFPCIGAFGTIIKETGIIMGIFIALYLTILAWIISTLFFQIFLGHMLLWIVIPLLMIIIIIGIFYILGRFNLFNRNLE